MEWYEIELDGGRTCKFPDYLIPGFADQQLSKQQSERGVSADYIGGIINGGKWGWLTRRHATDSTLLICALAGGGLVASHTFWRENEKSATGAEERCSIRCVEELFPEQALHDRVLLAVCLELGQHKTDVAIYTPTDSQVLRYIELHPLGIAVRCMSFLSKTNCVLSLANNYDGCLALGTESGVVLLLDVMAKQVIESGSQDIIYPAQKQLLRVPVCLRRVQDLTWETVNALIKECRSEDTHMLIQLELANHKSPVTSSICSLLPLEFMSGFAAGLEDGRILLYDLNQKTVLSQLRLPSNEPSASVEKLCYILPPDDPKPVFYIFAVYNQGGEQLLSTVHAINFKRRMSLDNRQNFLLRDFQLAAPRLRLLLDASASTMINCTTVSSYPTEDANNGTLLTVICWHSYKDQKNKFIVFDVNQWYKDEMPSQPASRHEHPHYLCGYLLSGLPMGLAFQLDPSSVVHFASLQRHDAHFYPNALSFECELLTTNGCRRYAHVGVQRRFLGSLCSQRARVFLNPEPYQLEIMALCLMPQFCEHNPNAKFSKRSMYELILSVALEHNRMGLLKSCVQSCLDGSFTCNMLSTTKLSLSIFSNWLVRRAAQIKERCSELCQGIFEHDAYALDDRECEEFQVLNTQLLRLQQLQQYILQMGKNCLGPELLQDLESTAQALGVLHEFQSALYWLIECQLLPDNNSNELEPLRLDYAERRRLQNRRLYIDELVQQQQSELQLQLDNSLYPPQSLRSLMHVLLLPDVQLQRKQQLLLYLLLDWDAIRSSNEDKNSSQLFDNFVLSFNIEESLVRCVRSFWLLDRDQLADAVEELYRGGSQSFQYADWQTKLLVESLLAGGAAKEAMQVVVMPPGPISAQLKLRVLLDNNDIPQAFHHARICEDENGRPLLEYFFEHCIQRGMFKVLGSLCLREHEEQLVYRLLRQCNTRKTDSVQLILLLKRCKYIEAVSFMDEAAEAQRRRSTLGDSSASDETSTLLSAYRTTMAPVTQSIAGTYFRIRDRLNGQQLGNCTPEPFSCQLAKQNVTGKVGGIFQSSALSAHWATLGYANEPRPLNSHNMPFLRNAAQAARQGPLHRRRFVRPTPYQYVEKRQLEVGHRQSSLQLAKRRRVMEGGKIWNDLTQLSEERELQQQQEEQLQLHDPQQVLALLQPPAFLQLKRSQPQLEQPQQKQQLPLPQQFPRPIIVKRRVSPLLFREQPETPTATERRSFSFKPPIQLEQERERALELEQQPNGAEEDDVLFMEIESEAPSPSPSSSSSDSSNSEYLSPLPSANVSLQVAQLEEDPDLDQQQPRETRLEVELPKQRSLMGPPPSGPQSRSSLHQEQSSSGFGSFASIQTGSSASVSLLNTFVPPVCSSKMCEVQSGLQMTTPSVSSSLVGSHYVKISERTTICGDIEEPSVVESPMPAASVWSAPTAAASAAAVHPGVVRLLDTTLGMSSYDVTATEQAAPQSPMETIDLGDDDETEDDDVEMQQEENDLQQVELAVQEDGDAEEEHSSRSRSRSSSVEQVDDDDDEEDEPNALDYNRASPSYSISSELSDMSSTDLVTSLPSDVRQDAPVYSIVVESTNSITTSRSPTSHTPTSFLPSDTNVSQNSSPRAPHGGAGDGTLYRANSLETVDDLDTTKGSLEEDDDVDEEDECVIALDGTEVRGYVARPEPVPACSSAELFAFKQSDDAGGIASGEQGEGQEEQGAGCPSLGATANSDSVQAYTINLDSSEPAESSGIPPVAAATSEEAGDNNSRDSVATVAKVQLKGDAEVAEDVQVEEMEVDASVQLDSDVEIMEPDEVSNHSLRLEVSDNEEEQAQPEQKTKEKSELSPKQPDIQKETPQAKHSSPEPEPERVTEVEVEPEPEVEADPQPEVEVEPELEVEAEPEPEIEAKSEPKVEPKPEPVLEVEPQPEVETEPEPEVEAKSAPEVEAEPEPKEKAVPEPEIEAKQQPEVEAERAPELEAEPQPDPAVGRLRTRRSVSGTPPPVERRSTRLRSTGNLSVDTTPNRASPLTLQGRRRSSLASEDLAESPQNARDSPNSVASLPSTHRMRLRSSDSNSNITAMETSSELTKRDLRAGSMPPMPTSSTSTGAVLTPKRRQKLLPKPLEAIQENAALSSSSSPRTRSRTQLNQPSPTEEDEPEEETGDNKRRTARSQSEPHDRLTDKRPQPALPSRKRGRKSSVELESQAEVAPDTMATPSPARVLRTRRRTLDLATGEPKSSSSSPVPVSVPAAKAAPRTPVNEASVPPKKRGRPLKNPPP
ncbi:protein ELYS homolog [Drosophila albomicans]|uniref:Protein ELYS homolog n=1 Tax=Drosophila albomicans TaxID=7291 RepID=A0A6P8ZGB7_DROAB|nr:protein ELYS homolog [Drosophila albomicans]